MSNTQLIQSPWPIRKGLDNPVSHLNLKANVTDGGTGKCAKLLLFLLPNECQSGASSSIQSKPRQIWTSVNTQEKTLYDRKPVDLKALHHDCQIQSSSLFWSGKQCISARQKYFDKALSEISFIKRTDEQSEKIKW